MRNNNVLDIERLFEIFPEAIKEEFNECYNKYNILEVVLDIGKRIQARFVKKSKYIGEYIITWQDLDYVLSKIGIFNKDNRAGIEKTLHRISCIRNQKGIIIGFTCRVGRSLRGPAPLIRDVLEEQKSILILGKPGVGKTAAIRAIAKVLADEKEKKVIIIDTSNEIAGAGNIPHPSLGSARRLQVIESNKQHNVMLEAIENHMPEIIIIDEISTEKEVTTTRTIAERGVQLIGTVHGTTLENLIRNPVLVELIGGIQSVTIGDQLAKKQDSQKTIVERRNEATFDLGIEIESQYFWVIYKKISNVIDMILKYKKRQGELRFRESHNRICIYGILNKFNLKLIKPLFYKQKNTIKINANKKKTFSKFTQVSFKYLDFNSINKNKFLFSYNHRSNLPKIYFYNISDLYLEFFNLKNIIYYKVVSSINEANLICAEKEMFLKNNSLQYFCKKKNYLSILLKKSLT